MGLECKFLKDLHACNQKFSAKAKAFLSFASIIFAATLFPFSQDISMQKQTKNFLMDLINQLKRKENLG